MPPPKDPIKRAIWLEKQSKSHMGHKAWNKDIPMSDEQREKLRIASTGRKQSQATRDKRSASLKGRFTGENHPRFGKKDSAETLERKRIAGLRQVFKPERRKNISKALTGRKITWSDKVSDTMVKLWETPEYRDNQLKSMGKFLDCRFRWGDENINYIDGRTPFTIKLRNSQRMKKWAQDVCKKDGYVDVFSGLRCKNLTPHHLKEFSIIVTENQLKTMEDAHNCEEMWDINNGMSLDWETHQNAFHRDNNGYDINIFNLPFQLS